MIAPLTLLISLIVLCSGPIAKAEVPLEQDQMSQDLIFSPPIDLERELGSITETKDLEFEAALRLAEEDIPVLTDQPKKALVETSTYTRLLISVGIVLAVAGVIVLVGRRWLTRAQREDSVTKVRLLTQLHLGPKRSVAVINVAGESLLIGITDHNINLLRNLSLLDEEIPQSVPRDFNQALDATEALEEEVSAAATPQQEEFKVTSVKQLVADRLKQMRPL